MEQELGRRQSQSRNSEIKKMKSVHMLEYQEAEKKFLEQINALKDKVGLSPLRTLTSPDCDGHYLICSLQPH